MTNARWVWVILPYLAVFVGMVLLKSAWGALIGFHIALLPVILFRWQSIRPALLAPTPWKYIGTVALTGLAAGAALWVIWPFAGLSAGFSTRLAGLGLVGWVWAPFTLYFVLINPVLEEVYWRKALGSASKKPAWVDFLFAGYHLIILGMFVGPGWLVAAFCGLVMASWFWRQVSSHSGSLLPAMYSHMLADLSLLVVLRGFSV